MGVRSRWLVTVLAALASFAGCWLGLAWARVSDSGTQVGVAAVPVPIVLAALGAWAERAREKKPKAAEVDDRVNAKVEDSPQGQAIGQMRDGNVVIAPGASLPNAVFNLGVPKADDGTDPLRDKASDPGGVLVVGDIPQEPAAFQPRAGLIAMLEQESGPRVSVVFAVIGIRGVGKTQVAAAYARRRIADRWRLVAWIDATDKVSMLAGLWQVAAVAGVSPASEDAVALAAGVRHWLEADGERRLVVFDNAVDLDGLRPFVPAGGAAQVVITSNRRSATGLGIGVPVDVFTEREALGFLAERTGLDDAAGARELAGELGFMPLGLAQAAALIARQHLSYGTYLERLRTLPVADYLDRVEGDAYPYRTAEAITLSLLSVEEADLSGQCAALMGLVSVLAETGVSRRLLHLTVAQTPGGEAAVEVDTVAGVLAEASLLGFSLDDAVVAHRLIMRVVRERLAADGTLPEIAAWAVQVLHRLADGIKLADGMNEAWRDPVSVRELAGHVRALTEHVHSHLDMSSADVAAELLRLRLRSVVLLNGLGDSTGQAIEAAEPLATDCMQTLGADHPDSIAASINLAYAYHAVGRTADAIPLYERTIADMGRIAGADRPSTLIARNNLANAYRAVGRTADAISLYERTLAVAERVLDADHPHTLMHRGNLANAYRDAGRTADAISLYERTLAVAERVLGPDHPHTLVSRNNLADAYRDAGQVSEALSLLEQTAADLERIVGIAHPNTLTARSNLATVYRIAGQTADAISLYERTLADAERVLGADHPDTLMYRGNLAGAYQDAGQTGKAISLYAQTLADHERILGPDHPHTLISRGNLALAYQHDGQTATAISLLERTLADRERVLGSDHPSTTIARRNLTAIRQLKHR